jgi:nucleotide-binding universal stress UspA family protein
MARYKKILVACDGSASGENALRQALRLACDEKCWIRVVTVVQPFEGELDLTGVGDVREAILRPARAVLARAEAIAREDGALIKASLEQGEAAQRLAAVAEDEQCGLIVMGRRGKTKLERAMVGSVTARVIGLASRDVLVVPLASAVAFERIVLATDGSGDSVKAAERAVDLAASYGGTLHALAVVDVPDEFFAEAPAAVDRMIEKAKVYVAAVGEKAAAAGVGFTPSVREGPSSEMILRVAAETRASLIVMGSHGRTGLVRLLMGSVTEKVIGSATCPVLVVKTPA